MKKKILFICNTDWFFISHRLPIALEAKRLGYEVHLATKFQDNNEYLLKNKVFTHNINFNRYKVSPYQDLVTTINLFLLLKNIRPDIVNTITIKPTLLGGLSLIFLEK